MAETLYRFILGSSSPSAPGYSEFLWRFAWIVTSVIALAYVSHLYFGGLRSAYIEVPSPIHATYVIKNNGERHIFGTLPVPSDCHGLFVSPKQLDATHFHLIFSTWQEPSRTCEPHEAIRNFDTVIFTQTEPVEFTALVDGKIVPLELTIRR